MSALKEAVAIAGEEIGEAIGNKEMAQRNRDDRNLERAKRGEEPILTEPGQGNKEKSKHGGGCGC